jgi:simple sugar transport system substrate-binding protein
MHLKLFGFACASICLLVSPALSQSGALDKAVGGYSFEDAAKEAPDTKNFHATESPQTIS